jgi:histidinol-phosphate aminotransferase
MKFNPVLDSLKPYKAGPSLAEIRERYNVERITEMAANEVPWGPFPEVVGALKAALGRLNRYPDGSCTELRALLADRLGVRPEQLSFGNGSCELLMLLGQALLTPKAHAVLPYPSFVMYQSIALANGAPFTAVPLKELEHDLEGMLAAIRSDTSLVVVCNPNNPTGTYIEPAALRAFLDRVPDDVVIALDEAYGEFVTSPLREETSTWVERFPNLIVLRTFSKIYGLAGLRIGYAIADPEVRNALDKVRQPFNVDSLAQVAATESLRHPERVAERRDTIAGERRRLGKGILTRSGYAMGCPGWIRVTIGQAQEGDLFVAAMRELREGKAHVGAQVTDSAVDAESLSPES